MLKHDCDLRPWRAPPLLLLAIAGLQLLLAHATGLSPWSSGGFGMFSTADAGGRRHLHAFVLRPGIEREMRVSRALEDNVSRVLALPSRSFATSLARELAALPVPDHGPATGVRIEIWRTRFDPATLAPSNEILRVHEIAVDGG